MRKTAPPQTPPPARAAPATDAAETGLTGARALPLRILLRASLPWLLTTGLMVLALCTGFLVMFGVSWGPALVLGLTCTLALAVYVAVQTPTE